MDRLHLPLNALRAFEAAARHLNVTRAALELRVTQAAVSHHIKTLEAQLGATLFRRLPRGLALTDEGAALAPMLNDAFDRLGAALDRVTDGRFTETLNVGVVGTFAAGWLIGRLDEFASRHPRIDLRVMTNNNRVDLAGDGLDLAVKFGDGAWHGVEATPILDAPLTPLSAPVIARRLREPSDLARETLLRSYRADEWARWFEAARARPPPIRGPMFDASTTMAACAGAGAGVALLPARLFEGDLISGRLVQPFDIQIDVGRYWLIRLLSRPETAAMAAFRAWLSATDTQARRPEPASPQR
jgi:LysR family transcriptional regulator of beta-lactamase